MPGFGKLHQHQAEIAAIGPPPPPPPCEPPPLPPPRPIAAAVHAGAAALNARRQQGREILRRHGTGDPHVVRCMSPSATATTETVMTGPPLARLRACARFQIVGQLRQPSGPARVRYPTSMLRLLGGGFGGTIRRRPRLRRWGLPRRRDRQRERYSNTIACTPFQADWAPSTMVNGRVNKMTTCSPKGYRPLVKSPTFFGFGTLIATPHLQ